MKIIKYEHSCLDIRTENSRLIIDPGVFSKLLTDLAGIDAVVITHAHTDHFDIEKLQLIANQNPGVKIFSTQQVIDTTPQLNIQKAEIDKPIIIDDLELEFYGQQHQLFHETQNVGVLVNQILFHPGDSYTQPDKAVKVLAAPACAPWLRIDEATAYIQQIHAHITFPIHNAVLSAIGESIYYRLLGDAAGAATSDWCVLQPTEFLEV